MAKCLCAAWDTVGDLQRKLLLNTLLLHFWIIGLLRNLVLYCVYESWVEKDLLQDLADNFFLMYLCEILANSNPIKSSNIKNFPFFAIGFALALYEWLRAKRS